MDSTEKQYRHYENVAEKYYKCRQLKNHLLLKELLWGYFLKDKDFLKKNNLLVLEPMCGFADGKSILEDHLNVDVEYDGFDISDTFLDIAKKETGINIFKADATTFKPTKKYDIVLLIGGLHHIYNTAEEFVSTVYSALNDGGHFINFEPTQNNYFTKIIRTNIYKKNPMFDADTEEGFDLNILNDIYSSCGFNVVDQLYPGLLSYVLYYNPEAFSFFYTGGKKCVRLLFNMEKMFYRNFIGRKLSFATLTILRK
ncbi:class I SAM-dependent methyltransferase [Planctomycetota bacterium]